MVPERGCHLWVVTCCRASLTASALLEVFGILTLPDAINVPEILQEHLGAVHELLSVGRVESNGATRPAHMRAELPPLVHDESRVKLCVDLFELGHRLVVVKAEDVHGACDLELRRQIEKQIETQVLQRSRLFTCVRILIVLPAQCNDRLRESEAPEDLGLVVVLSEDAIVFACVRFDEWALISGDSLLVGIDESLPGVDYEFWI